MTARYQNLSLDKLRDFPARIQLQTHDRCNYRCGMCPYPTASEGARGTTFLDTSLFDRITNEVALHGDPVVLCIMLQNEPMLDKRFFDFLEAAHLRPDAYTSIATVTNGSVLTERVLDRLLKYDRFHLTVSINSTTAGKYLKIHGRDNWARIHRLLSSWEGARSRVRLSYVLDRDLDDARQFNTYWSELGYSVRVIPQNNRAGALSDRLFNVERRELFGYCHLPLDTLHVLANGQVILCCQDWSHDQIMGDLNQQSIVEIWNGPILKRVRELSIRGEIRTHGPCNRCDYPLRSTTRTRIEALVHGAELPTPATEGGIQPHVAELNGEPVIVVAALPSSRGLLVIHPSGSEWPTSTALFTYKIGHRDLLNLGHLVPVEESVTVHPNPDFLSENGINFGLLYFQEPSELYDWYVADWSLA